MHADHKLMESTSDFRTKYFHPNGLANKYNMAS